MLDRLTAQASEVATKVRRPRIVFFDLEGTLLKKAAHLDNSKVAASAWTLVAESLGEKALEEEEASKDRWNQGGYSNYLQWMEDSVRFLHAHGLNERRLETVLASIEQVPHVEEVVREIKSWGCTTAILTGGFKRLADRVQVACRIDHSFAACDLFFDAKGDLIHWNLLPADYEGKVDFMRLLMRELGTDAESCVFVGDGKNDVPLAKEVGLSIAFNAQPELRAVCDEVVDQPSGQEDFLAVLECIKRCFAV